MPDDFTTLAANADPKLPVAETVDAIIAALPDTIDVERVAKAINGPHDPSHVGAEKLRELQDYRWENQTAAQERGYKMNQARAAVMAAFGVTL